MSDGKNTADTSDTRYNLASTLYHILESDTKYAQYIKDAERFQLTDVAEFFQQLRQADQDNAQKVVALLAKHVGQALQTGAGPIVTNTIAVHGGHTSPTGTGSSDTNG